MRSALAFCCLIAALGASGARAQAPEACQVHVVLFVPADVKAPARHQQRIDEIVVYAEGFFRRELKRWGHDRVVMPFRRGAGGRVEVMVVRGKEKLAAYKPVEVRMEVMDTLREKGRIGENRQVWWILVYPGEPPARFASFLGGYGVEIGGWAVCNLDMTPGKIDPGALLGSDFLEKLFLKGMIHELGHGFQMPHVGPLERDRAGNTLMGPTHVNYRRVMPRPEDRVYLSEAEAAMLAAHPAFQGKPDRRGPLPKVEVEGMKYVFDVGRKAVVVSGKVKASQRALYAFVGDESDARPGEYWTKTYVGKVGADGTFEVLITEPAAAKGTLKTWFAFEGGAQTGDGKERGRGSGVTKEYTYAGQRWRFE